MNNIPAEVDPRIYQTFEGLNVTQSQAIAEFVDNSIQSFLDYENTLVSSITNYKFKVLINIEWGETANNKTPAKRIIIKDNAAGLNSQMLSTAFITAKAKLPQSDKSLNEWGMGMKTMACWLCNKLTMKTKAINEQIERTIIFDKKHLISSGEKTISVNEKVASSKKPYTEIILDDLVDRNLIHKANFNTIKKTLASIYRPFLRKGNIQIYLNDEILTFDEYDVLVAPFYKTKDAQKVEWKRPISIELFGKRVHGFIGVLKEMKQEQRGFVLIRRGRVIVGEDLKSRLHIPELCGSNGSPQEKRIYGELEVEGFDTTFNKNGIAQDEELKIIINNIAKIGTIRELLQQAQNYRKDNSTKPQNKNEYNLVLSSSPNEGGSVIGSGKYHANSSVNIKAIPNSNYEFVEWSDGIKEPNRIIFLKKDLSYSALYKLKDNTNIVKPKPPVTPIVTTPVSNDDTLLDKVNLKINGVSYDLYIRINTKQNEIISNPTVTGKFITCKFNYTKCGFNDLTFIDDNFKNIIINIVKSLCKTMLGTGKIIDFLDDFNAHKN